MKDNSKKTKKSSYQAKTLFLFLEILKILQQDPKLIWRQRPKLNLNFQGAKIITNSLGLRNKEIDSKKNKNKFRIACLGASPTFGWGVNQDKTYSACLEKLLRENKSKKNPEVINAGEIGFSSYQGLILLKEYILNFSPDLITVSYVINDVDRYRFYRSDYCSDKELMPKNKVAIFLENFFSRSDFYNWTKHIIKSVLLERIKKINTDISEIHSNRKRVSIQDYKKNLESFIEIAKGKNIDLIFIVMPVNLPEAPNLSQEQLEQETIYLKKACQQIKENNYQTAINFAQEAVKCNSCSSTGYYYLGVCFENKNNQFQAEKYFRKAKEAESRQCGRWGRIYNEIMKDVAKKNNIVVVDVASFFAKISKDTNKYLFLDIQGDTIHPNSKGHEVIAGQLHRSLIEYGIG